MLCFFFFSFWFSLRLSPNYNRSWFHQVVFSCQFLLFVDVKFSFHSTEFICTLGIPLKCYKCEINSGYKWICVDIFKFRHLQHDHRNWKCMFNSFEMCISHIWSFSIAALFFPYVSLATKCWQWNEQNYDEHPLGMYNCVCITIKWTISYE